MGRSSRWRTTTRSRMRRTTRRTARTCSITCRASRTCTRPRTAGGAADAPMSRCPAAPMAPPAAPRHAQCASRAARRRTVALRRHRRQMPAVEAAVATRTSIDAGRGDRCAKPRRHVARHAVRGGGAAAARDGDHGHEDPGSAGDVVQQRDGVADGLPEGAHAGPNCRFLQGKRTEAAAVRVMVNSIRAAKPTTVRVTNYRRTARSL